MQHDITPFCVQAAQPYGLFKRDAGCLSLLAQMEGGTREAVEVAILSRVTHLKAEAETTLQLTHTILKSESCSMFTVKMQYMNSKSYLVGVFVVLLIAH